ncbi:MAG TPA: UPF0182 family protein [Gemmatimonadales bacterium]|nr:UPF0182 family protein [Gemmatimonadales bacterium]
MTRRRRAIAIALAGLVVLLFAGRWTAVVLADRWWAQQFSPQAASFLTQWHFLRLALELGSVIIATGWFIGQLLTVYRAIGSVQIPRHVGNVEILEALSPRLLLAGTIGLGVLLGVLVGTGAPIGWREVTLAWHGVSYGITDPLLGHDLGLYVAQLPLWRATHGFVLLLVLLAFAGSLTLYLVVGAVRWIDGRPAINTHARRHLGWLLAAVALTLAWGYVLEPFEQVAGLAGPINPSGFRAVALVSPALTGTALMVALISALWALRPRHTLLAASWIVLGLASAAGHYLLPALMRDPAEAAAAPEVLRRLEATAFDLTSLEQISGDALDPVTESPDAPLSLWDHSMTSRMIPDSAELLAVDPALIDLDGKRRPAWLTVSAGPGGAASVLAIADDRVGAAGGPLFYRPGDTLAYPTPYPVVTLPRNAARPLAPNHYLGSDAEGVDVDSWARRIALAWALQVPGLLTSASGPQRLAWRLPPTERLSHLIPFAEWGTPAPRIIDGRLVWLVNGYLSSATFPLVPRMPWRGHQVGAVHAGYLGTVDAMTGETHVYLRPQAAPPARAWGSVAAGVVEPFSALPPGVADEAPYPEQLFAVQAAVLANPLWDAGEPLGHPGESGTLVPDVSLAWAGDSTGALLTAVFEHPEERRIESVLIGGTESGRIRLQLVTVDSSNALPTPSALEATWDRFPLFDQVRDSVRGGGGTLETGPVRLWIGNPGLAAYQVSYGTRGTGRPSVTWLSVATGDRVGAGRELAEAWSNLNGKSVPMPPGTVTGALAEARRWMRLADSALQERDWEAFGRAFAALQALLAPPDSGQKSSR